MSDNTGEHPHCQRCGSPSVLFLFRPLELWLCGICYQRARRAENRANGQFDDYDLDALELDLDDFDDLHDLKAALKAAFKRAHEQEERAALRAQASRRATSDALKAYGIFFAAPSFVIMLAGWLAGHTTLVGGAVGWLGLQAVVLIGAAWISYRDWRQHGYLRRHW